ncbi:hypothetical protein A1Q2_05495 [Trichosporon asahii var. asahii CBS 8904]|uniref:Uncharacterized protein n=1 Tax=Trichosporon asahii var. asahii (strain CBS 8904) TaxID=1220162 RepID=K1VLJ6_TRIAC|nr:hypothetical protein A1Q2_05495 [Trichosporon asahii var. asahii CBS 8904]
MVPQNSENKLRWVVAAGALARVALFTAAPMRGALERRPELTSPSTAYRSSDVAAAITLVGIWRTKSAGRQRDYLVALMCRHPIDDVALSRYQHLNVPRSVTPPTLAGSPKGCRSNACAPVLVSFVIHCERDRSGSRERGHVRSAKPSEVLGFNVVLILVGAIATWKSYPTLGDMALWAGLLGCFPELVQRSGNANFFYAATMVYGLNATLALADVLTAVISLDIKHRLRTLLHPAADPVVIIQMNNLE